MDNWCLYYLGHIFPNFCFTANKTAIYIAPIIGSSVIAVIGTFYLPSRFGVVGVVWGIALAGFVYTFLCFLIMIMLLRNRTKKISFF